MYTVKCVCGCVSVYLCVMLFVYMTYITVVYVVFVHADPTSRLVASAVANDIYSSGWETGHDYPKYVTDECTGALQLKAYLNDIYRIC